MVVKEPLDCLQASRSGTWSELELEVAAGYRKKAKTLLFGEHEAAMEVAEAVGIIDLNDQSPDVMSRHSGPAGLMFKHLIDQGAKRISVGLGGSCTSDGGLGFLSVLGLECYDKDQKLVQPYPKNATDIQSIKWNPTHNFCELEIHMLNDVENPLVWSQWSLCCLRPSKRFEGRSN